MSADVAWQIFQSRLGLWPVQVLESCCLMHQLGWLKRVNVVIFVSYITIYIHIHQSHGVFGVSKVQNQSLFDSDEVQVWDGLGVGFGGWNHLFCRKATHSQDLQGQICRCPGHQTGRAVIAWR